MAGPNTNMRKEIVAILAKVRMRKALISKHDITPTVATTFEHANKRAYIAIEQLSVALFKQGFDVVINDDRLVKWCAIKKEVKVLPKKVVIANSLKKATTDRTTVLARFEGNITYQGARVEMLAFLPNTCLKCGTGGPGQLMTADHVYPKSTYKLLTAQVVNLQPLCVRCNHAKADREPVDYRTPKMKLDLVQRLLRRRSDKLLPISTTDIEIEIITHRILLHTYKQIANTMHCSETFAGKICRRLIPHLNAVIIKLITADKQFKKCNSLVGKNV